MSRRILSGNSRLRATQLAFTLAATLAPALAHAHFVLKAPANWKTQDGTGLPEKSGMCGNETKMGGGAYEETGTVTPFMAGQKIMITINEAIAHPGHYYVALGVDGEADLPPMPVATNNCANVPVQDPPVFPVLADNVLPHTMQTPLNGDQTFEVTLPSDVTCTKCRLQVLEYMSNNGTNCFYRHCADISISAASGGAGGMGSGGAPSGGAGGVSAGASQGGASTAAGMGGMMGQAGTVIAAAGMPGASGSAAGGQSGGTAGGTGTSGAPTGTAGAATGTGGQATSTGGAVGAGGTGGSVTGTGGGSGAVGAGGTGPGAAGAPAGVAAAEEPADDTGGCGITGRSSRSSRPYGVAGALALGLWLVRRRRA